jgi:hypothetical protein
MGMDYRALLATSVSSALLAACVTTCAGDSRQLHQLVPMSRLRRLYLSAGYPKHEWRRTEVPGITTRTKSAPLKPDVDRRVQTLARSSGHYTEELLLTEGRLTTTKLVPTGDKGGELFCAPSCPRPQPVALVGNACGLAQIGGPPDGPPPCPPGMEKMCAKFLAEVCAPTPCWPRSFSSSCLGFLRMPAISCSTRLRLRRLRWSTAPCAWRFTRFGPSAAPRRSRG